MGKWRSRDALTVIDRLVVGPVIVEETRLTAPYTIHADGAFATTELVYKYEEPVLTPNDAASENLASMIAAQVALNYGLFCKEIAFRGTYDDHDRRFLEEMAENTAREIYVNKILNDNPFLLDDAQEIPAEKAERYLSADLIFGGRNGRWLHKALGSVSRPPTCSRRFRSMARSTGRRTSSPTCLAQLPMQASSTQHSTGIF